MTRLIAPLEQFPFRLEKGEGQFLLLLMPDLKFAGVELTIGTNHEIPGNGLGDAQDTDHRRDHHGSDRYQVQPHQQTGEQRHHDEEAEIQAIGSHAPLAYPVGQFGGKFVNLRLSAIFRIVHAVRSSSEFTLRAIFPGAIPEAVGLRSAEDFADRAYPTSTPPRWPAGDFETDGSPSLPSDFKAGLPGSARRKPKSESSTWNALSSRLRSRKLKLFPVSAVFEYTPILAATNALPLRERSPKSPNRQGDPPVSFRRRNSDRFRPGVFRAPRLPPALREGFRSRHELRSVGSCRRHQAMLPRFRGQYDPAICCGMRLE